MDPVDPRLCLLSLDPKGRTVPFGEGMAGTGVTLALQEQPALAVP